MKYVQTMKFCQDNSEYNMYTLIYELKKNYFKGRMQSHWNAGLSFTH